MNQGCYNGIILEPSGVHCAVRLHATLSVTTLNDRVAFHFVVFGNYMNACESNVIINL